MCPKYELIQVGDNMKYFKPMMYIKDVFSINYSKLKKQGIKMLVFDLDNTISLIDEMEPKEEFINLFTKLKKDFEILIASNNNKERVSLFAKKLGVNYLYYALKPTLRLKKFIKKNYTYKFNEIAMIGDQLLTDMLVGNRSGMFTIYVDQLGKKDLKVTSLNRYLETKLLKRLEIKKGVYYEES